MKKHRNELITWSHTLMCGIKVIDEQHKSLVDFVNDLFNHVTGNDEEEREYFKKVIEQAVKYVRIHFKTEEKIMLATKFTGYAEHKKAHDSFVLAVSDKIKEYESKKKTSLSSFTKFLKDWVLSHIAVMDKQYFIYFRKLASRKADGKLSINSSDVAIFS